MIPIFTFVSDESSYHAMLASFASGGFSNDIATFTRLTSRGRPGEAEPYSTLTELIASGRGSYFILCHQDVRLDQGDGAAELRKRLAELSTIDPGWAIAGDAGGSDELTMVRRITDPHGGSTPDSLPARVQTLDENFLVVRTGTGLACSPGLRGFHLYGTDLCMQARLRGRTCYVIDFHVHHLSAGSVDVHYATCRSRFLRAWNHRFHARYVRAPMEVLFMSRWAPLRSMLGSTRARRVIKNRPWLGRLVGAVLARH